MSVALSIQESEAGSPESSTTSESLKKRLWRGQYKETLERG